MLGGVLALKVVFRRPLVAANAGGLGLGVLLGAMAGPLPTGVIAAAALLSGFGWAINDITWTATVQQRVPRHAVSRVISYEWTTGQIVTSAGFALAGPMAGAFGISTVLLTLAAVVVVASLSTCFLPAVFRVTYGTS